MPTDKMIHGRIIKRHLVAIFPHVYKKRALEILTAKNLHLLLFTQMGGFIPNTLIVYLLSSNHKDPYFFFKASSVQEQLLMAVISH